MRNKTFLASHLLLATKRRTPTKIKAGFSSEIKDNPPGDIRMFCGLFKIPAN